MTNIVSLTDIYDFDTNQWKFNVEDTGQNERYINFLESQIQFACTNASTPDIDLSINYPIPFLFTCSGVGGEPVDLNPLTSWLEVDELRNLNLRPGSDSLTVLLPDDLADRSAARGIAMIQESILYFRSLAYHFIRSNKPLDLFLESNGFTVENFLTCLKKRLHHGEPGHDE
jgi:hypothetical protein